MSRRQSGQTGYTLLELVAALFLVGAMMVPTTALITDALDYNRTIEVHNEIRTLAVSTMEQQISRLAVRFKEESRYGKFSKSGMQHVAYRVECSDNSRRGGIPGQLMVINVTVWEDNDSDRRLDAGELSVDLASKMSNQSGG